MEVGVIIGSVAFLVAQIQVATNWGGGLVAMLLGTFGAVIIFVLGTFFAVTLIAGYMIVLNKARDTALIRYYLSKEK